MQKKNILTLIISLAVCGLGLFAFSAPVQAAGNIYYAAPPSHNSAPVSLGNCTSANPCTPKYAINTKAVAGDVVLLKDGIYTGSDYMIDVRKSGSEGNPITIKAENDGKVIIDGQMSRKPCSVAGTDTNRWHDINIEGIVCKNSNNGVVQISFSDRIQLKRVSGYNAYVPGNYHVFTVWHTTNVLLEDCVASGSGRDMYDASDTDHTTIRRCWGKEVNYVNPGGVGDIIQVYGSNNAIVENVVGINETGITADGIVTWNKYYNTLYHGDHNTYSGNILYNLPNVWHYMNSSAHFQLHDNKYINNVSIGASYGLLVDGDDAAVIKNNTIVDTVNTAMAITTRIINPGDADYPKESPFYVNALIRNNNIAKINGPAGSSGISKSSESGVAADHDYNNIFNYTNPFSGTAQGAHETTIEPDFETIIYGKGAYLMLADNLKGKGENGADIGAEVLYRYVDGVLTTTPLWPWPMEARICAETGYSVTYETGYAGCAKGGGLWKTLDGVYDSNPANLIDVTADGKVNIKDIQACIKVITGSNMTYENQCSVLASPTDRTNIKDIQVIIREIINPSSTPQDSPFGLHPADAQGSYSAAVDMGARWHRPSMYMMWSSVQADINSSNYDFAFYDNYYGSVSQEINILANIVPDNPKRLNNYLLPNSFLPQDEEKYLQFVKVAIERYDGDGTADMPGLNNPIKYWQVGNEPNDRGDREDFAQLQKMTYEAIKSVCLECKVLIGGAAQPTVLGGGGEFVFDSNEYFSNFSIEYEPYLAELAGTGFDIFDFHWYGNAEGDYKKIQAIYEGINSRLRSYGYENVDSWVTEMGAYSGEPIDAAYGHQSEKQQASDYLKRFIYPLSIGIKKVFPAFGLVEGFKNNDGYFDHTGFIYDGKGSNDLGAGIKKLAYYSYKKMTETLEGSDWSNIQKIQESDGIYIYKFNKNGKNIWVAWNDNTSSQTISLDVGSANSVKITEAVPKFESGKDVADYSTAFNSETKTASNGQISLTLGDKPVFVEE